MKKFLLISAVLTLTVFVSTDTPIQYISAQHHWQVFGKTEHTHVECDKRVLYTQITGQIVVNCQIQLFHVDGKLSQIWSNTGFVVVNSQNTWKEFVNIPGNPNDVVIETIQFIIEPKWQYGDHTFPQHGWGFVHLRARTLFNDGTSGDTTLTMALYSAVNLSSPEVPLTGEGLLVRAMCEPRSSSGPWGALISSFRQKIPMNIIKFGDTPNPAVFTYTYAGPQEGTTERRLDPDLHHGIPGTLVTSPFTFDSNVSGSGDHKFSFKWTQTRPNEEDSCLLVVPITVDGSVVEPPPPPPIPEWQLINPNMFRLGDTIKTCDVDNKCTDPVVIH